MASPTKPQPSHPPLSTGPLGSKTLWLTSHQAVTQLSIKVIIQIPVHEACSLQHALCKQVSLTTLPASSWLLSAEQQPINPRCSAAGCFQAGCLLLDAVLQRLSKQLDAHCACCFLRCCTLPFPPPSGPAKFCTLDAACVHVDIACWSNSSCVAAQCQH